MSKPLNDEEIEKARGLFVILAPYHRDNTVRQNDYDRLIATVDSLKNDFKDCFEEVQIEQRRVIELEKENSKQSLKDGEEIDAAYFQIDDLVAEKAKLLKENEEFVKGNIAYKQENEKLKQQIASQSSHQNQS